MIPACLLRRPRGSPGLPVTTGRRGGEHLGKSGEHRFRRPARRLYRGRMRTATRHAPVGLTPDAGWALDVRRTLPAPPEDVWRRLHTEWLPQWLGVDSVPQMVGAPLRQDGAIRGRVSGCHMGRRVRLRWTPATLDHETIFQVTVQEPLDPGVVGTVIEIHQERLLGPAERQTLLAHWTAVLDELVVAYALETAGSQDLPG